MLLLPMMLCTFAAAYPAVLGVVTVLARRGRLSVLLGEQGSREGWAL